MTLFPNRLSDVDDITCSLNVIDIFLAVTCAAEAKGRYSFHRAVGLDRMKLQDERTGCDRCRAQSAAQAVSPAIRSRAAKKVMPCSLAASSHYERKM